MISEEMRYYKGSANSRETVEVDEVRSDGMYITTCVVNIDLLICGISAYPCGNGDDYKFIPEQQLKILEFVQEEHKKLIEGVRVKTLDGWHKSGLPTFEYYCKVGDAVAEDIVDYFANCVPPVTFRYGLLQAGEPFSHEPDENGHYRATYTTFSRTGEKDDAGRSIWLYNGCCFKGQADNRGDMKTRLERRIEALREQIREEATT